MVTVIITRYTFHGEFYAHLSPRKQLKMKNLGETLAREQDPKSLWMVTAAMKLKDTCSLKGKL